MENEQSDEGERDQRWPSDLEGRPTPEATKESNPSIYVASLSDYNQGLLHGAWIEADAEIDDIHVAIQEMLSCSPSGQSEEYAIFDFDGFGPWRVDEYESIAMVSAVAKGIATHGNAFAHWVEILSATEPDELAGFEDAYFGHWTSILEYTQEFVEGIGLSTEGLVPESFSYYLRFDYEGFARDMEMYGDISTSEGDGGVYVFEGPR